MSISCVSIIVPVYNTASYLRECMDSILCQTYENLEIILINDGSTDESGAICDEYVIRDKRVQVFHQKNIGVSSARNLGIEKATGKYLQFVDSDDVLSPNITKFLVDQLESNEVQLAICNVEHFSSIPDLPLSLNIRNIIPGIKSVSSFAILPCDINDKRYGHGFHEIACPYARIFVRDIVVRFEIRFPVDVFFTEDVVFVYAYLSKIEKICSSDKVFYYYREHSTNSTSRQLCSEKDWASNFSRSYRLLVKILNSWPNVDEDIKETALACLHCNHAIMIMFWIFVTRKHAPLAKLWNDVRYISSDEFSGKSLEFYVPEQGNSRLVPVLLRNNAPFTAYLAIWVHFWKTKVKRIFSSMIRR